MVKKTATGARSTDEEVLEKLAEDYPLPAKILEHRGLAKLKGTYTDKLAQLANPRTGRVHTHYAQAVAVTGRLSQQRPQPAEHPDPHARGPARARGLRGAAGLRDRQRRLQPDRAAHHGPHQRRRGAAARLHRRPGRAPRHGGRGVRRGRREQVSSEQRRYAKVINFGLIYGMSAFGLAKNLGIENKAAADLHRPLLSSATPASSATWTRPGSSAKAQGYVETVFGRRLYLPEINSPNGPRRSGAERAAINAPMQGTAADLIKLSMVAVQQVLDAEQRGTKMIMQVHDELVFEVPEAEVDWVRDRNARA